MGNAMHDQLALYYFYMGMMAGAQMAGAQPYTCTRAQGNKIKYLAIAESEREGDGGVNPPPRRKREHPQITDAKRFGTYKGK